MVDISMHKSFPHFREIELAKLLESEPLLADSICDYGHKFVVASGNRNLILTFLEEFLWGILIKLWDSGHLDQSPGAKKLSGADTGKSVEIALKDKQLKSAQDVIKSLRSEISRLNRQRQIERAASIAQVVSAPTDTAHASFVVDAIEGTHESGPLDTPPNDTEEESDFFVEVGICTDPEPVVVLQRCEVTTETDPDPLETECANLRLMIAKAEADLRASTESVSGGDSEDRPLPSETDVFVTESPRVALLRTRTEAVFEQVNPTMPVDESTGGSSPLVSTERSRLADLKARELELMREREIADEMRIEELLREIVEKDEIIKTFNDELDRVRSRPLPFAAPVTQFDETDTLTAHSVSGRIVEERLLEIHELRDENSRLTNLVLVLEKRFSDSKTVFPENGGDARNAAVDVGVATDVISTLIETPSLKIDHHKRPTCTVVMHLGSIAIVGTGQSLHEKHLEEERDKEAARAARAIEETRKVSVSSRDKSQHCSTSYDSLVSSRNTSNRPWQVPGSVTLLDQTEWACLKDCIKTRWNAW
jgi:hypothetical protein